MFRMTSASILALASVGLATAGQIQIGGTNGLTSSYILSGCSGVGGCVAGTKGTGSEKNYDNVLFSGAVNGATAPVPYSGYSTSSANTGTITDAGDGVTFSMINDGTTGGASNNFWSLPQSGNPTMVIPIGVFGVSSVWTMINTELAYAATFPSRDVTLTFNFGTTANAATTQAVQIKLTNSNASSTPNGQIQNSVDCSPASVACGGVSAPASGPTVSSTTIPNTAAGGSGSALVDTNLVYSSAYTSASGSYAGSSGSVVLDDQGFIFGTNISLSALGIGDNPLNTYLVSISMKESGTVSGSSIALSAITVDTVPEPAAVLLFLTGLGMIGIARFRRGKA